MFSLWVSIFQLLVAAVDWNTEEQKSYQIKLIVKTIIKK